tara:strand:- start:96 stop:407 length:312 start_codon:yes stop_codon:yes gene_type:complete
MIITLDESNFDQKTSSGVTLVDFYADWCGPCKRMTPVLESLAKTLIPDQIQVAKVNVDHSPSLSAKYGVRSIPMFALIKDGKLVNTLIGSKPEGELLAFATSS